MAILGLLILGIVLLEIEILFVPGTTIVGLIGFLFSLIGIVLTFKIHGAQAGWVVTGIYLALMAASIYFGFKSGLWKKFALKSKIDSKVNDEVSLMLIIGDIGTTKSVLRPFGTAEFNGKLVEVSSNGNHVDEGKAIRISKIESGSIIVETIN